ncbi:hypothetical protein EV424DRAFT_1545341 [Suillus variegatus]|nr:hypothetical protein EV424DRAFT_1545341 [Suillus variegatus]
MSKASSSYGTLMSTLACTRLHVFDVCSIKREIGHLCHDEQRPPKTGGKQGFDAVPTTSSNRVDPARSMAQPMYGSTMPLPPAIIAWPMSVPSGAFLYQPETLWNEFSVLTYVVLWSLHHALYLVAPTTPYISNSTSAAEATSNSPAHPPEAAAEEPTPPFLPSATKTEKFLLTVADQESGTRDERLNRAIRSKYVADLLKPYDYVKMHGCQSGWISKEVFERLLLDYDRVFSAISGAEQGHLCIYELMAEESAVNYWEKYGHIG